MPDLQEVFQMTTQKIRPDPGFVDRQNSRQRRLLRSRKTGALVVVAAMAVALVIVVVASAPGRRSGPAIAPSTATVPPTAAMGSESFFVDVSSGRTAPLPASIAGAGIAYPVSPDGSQFAYNPCCGQAEIAAFVSDVAGTDVRKVTPNAAYGPRWSPDGSSLVYHRHVGVLGDLFVVDVQTGETTRVTHLDQPSRSLGWWFMAPTFAPDGRTILFHLARFASPGYVWDLWSVPVTGGDPTLVRRNAGFGSYSPDGETLMYLSPIDDVDFTGDGLWVAPVDGGAPRKLVEASDIALPRWSPDGTRIAYAQRSRIYVIDVASGVSTRVADGGVAEWFDDETLVVGEGGCPGC
jgi:hypothetical protein